MFFLCVDKPAGYTSHDIVSLFRILTGIKRIGHTGTLDPFATGVLVLAFNDATKLIGHIPTYPKRYQCVLKLGTRTETADCTGDVVETLAVPDDYRREIMDVLPTFTGVITQTPPIYSAIKVNGKRLYEYARQGLDVEIPSREITVHELQMVDCVDGVQVDDQKCESGLDVLCTKGTYVRTLGCDIAEAIGTVGHLSVLRRLQSDGVDISQAITLKELATLVTEESVEDWRLALSKEGRSLFTRRSRPEVLKALYPYHLSVETVFDGMQSVETNDEESLRLAQGACIPSLKKRLPSEGLTQVLWQGRQLALVRPDGSIARVNPSIADMRIAAQPAPKPQH